MSSDVKKSKFLSLVLRHDPGSIGVHLDENGWASLDELLERAPRDLSLSSDDIRRIVKQSDKQRFALDVDQNRIRANQGHSVTIDLQLESIAPPATLYHGTANRFLESILAEGLVRGKRHHVHLSDSVDTASRVGERYGNLVLLRIHAGQMHTSGHTFYRSENGVWLVDSVPANFIDLAAV